MIYLADSHLKSPSCSTNICQILQAFSGTKILEFCNTSPSKIAFDGLELNDGFVMPPHEVFSIKERFLCFSLSPVPRDRKPLLTSCDSSKVKLIGQILKGEGIKIRQVQIGWFLTPPWKILFLLFI